MRTEVGGAAVGEHNPALDTAQVFMEGWGTGQLPGQLQPLHPGRLSLPAALAEVARTIISPGHEEAEGTQGGIDGDPPHVNGWGRGDPNPR